MLALASTILHAEEKALPKSPAAAPPGKTVLRVSGNIANFNSKDHKFYDFTINDLKALGESSVQATTQWSPPKSIFTGALLRDVLKVVGAKPNAKDVIYICNDGYAVRTPIVDAAKWNVVVSYKLNGESLATAKNGPFWIMYPIDDNPKELSNDATIAKIAWGLTEIQIK